MNHKLKIIFAGSPEFGAIHLQALLDANFDIAIVITKPDKPTGRGKKLTATPVKELALKNNLPILQPKTLRSEEIQNELKKINADVFVDVACGMFVPKEVLEMTQHGCVNVHPSLLPRWRGASPIQHTILAGDKETAVTIMRMDEGWDTGPVFSQTKCEVKNDDTTESLRQRLAEIGKVALIEVLKKLEDDAIKAVAQPEKGAIYAKKIEKEHAKIDWTKTAIELDREIRAFNPWPVAYTEIGDEIIRIWQVEVLQEKSDKKPGTIISFSKDGIDVATGKFVLRILKMQFSGGKVLTVAEILNGKKDFFAKHRVFH